VSRFLYSARKALQLGTGVVIQCFPVVDCGLLTVKLTGLGIYGYKVGTSFIFVCLRLVVHDGVALIGSVRDRNEGIFLY